MPRRGVATGSIPFYGIPQKEALTPIVPTEQWGAVPRYSIALGSVPFYGIPQKYVYVPPIPPVIGGGGGGGGKAIRWYEAEWKQGKKIELRNKIIRDDDEIAQIIATITPFL